MFRVAGQKERVEKAVKDIEARVKSYRKHSEKIRMQAEAAAQAKHEYDERRKLDDTIVTLPITEAE
jgi:hypothetical protein